MSNAVLSLCSTERTAANEGTEGRAGWVETDRRHSASRGGAKCSGT